MLYTRSATEVEATRRACEAALLEGVAVCMAGGTHHAFREHGEGYCVFNDVAIAIRDLQLKQPGIRIMVVDTDAHQGNGTNSLLDHDPRVFTYSIHVGKNYPSRKVNGSMDVETVRYVEGEMYLKQLFTSLAAALDIFHPDLVIWVAGADNHRNDRFGQMLLTLKDMHSIAKSFHKILTGIHHHRIEYPEKSKSSKTDKTETHDHLDQKPAKALRDRSNGSQANGSRHLKRLGQR